MCIHKQEIISFKEENLEIVNEFLMLLAMMHPTLH